MDDETRLLPCLFGGNETAPEICSAEEVLDAMQPPTAWECYAVVCAASPKGLGGGCGASSGFRMSREAAAAAWNQRRSNNANDC